jgi:hypothetical protein
MDSNERLTPYRREICLHGSSFSTNAWSRPSALSQSREILSRARVASKSRRVRSSQMRSRPTRELRASPASSRACKCFVTACRDTDAPSAKCTIDSGPSPQSRATIRNRVSSPSAAKIGAASASLAAGVSFAAAEVLDRVTARCNRSGREGQVLLNQLRLRSPTFIVGRERFGAPLDRDLIETRLGDGQHRSARGLFQLEYY